jgi:hypothetical protein
MIATFSTSFLWMGSPLWLTNKSSQKTHWGTRSTRPRLRVSVRLPQLKQVASTAVFQAWGKRLHGLFNWTNVSTQGSVYGMMGTREDPGNDSCEHMHASQPAGGLAIEVWLCRSLLVADLDEKVRRKVHGCYEPLVFCLPINNKPKHKGAQRPSPSAGRVKPSTKIRAHEVRQMFCFFEFLK